MATFARRRGAVPSVVSVPVGTTGLYETDGTFEVPADGNKNNPAQTYGNGGASGGTQRTGEAGQPGAVIITYLGA